MLRIRKQVLLALAAGPLVAILAALAPRTEGGSAVWTGKERRTSVFSVLYALLILLCFLFVMVMLALYAWATGGVQTFVVGTLFSLAACCVGGFAGFILGLPRYSRVPAESNDGTVKDDERPSGAPPSRFEPSSNFEQISDWLTKLLIGAGLVQLGAIATRANALVDAVAAAFTADESASAPMSARVVAGATLVIHFVLGFIGVFVSTNIWYRRRLAVNMSIDSPSSSRG